MSKRAIPAAFEEESLRFCTDVMEHVRLQRTLRGWSQRALADVIGMRQEHISAMERSPRSVTVDRLYVMLRSLGYELVIQPQRGLSTEAKEDTDAHAKIYQHPGSHQD